MERILTRSLDPLDPRGELWISSLAVSFAAPPAMHIPARFFALALAALGLFAASPADAAAGKHKSKAAAVAFPMKPAEYKALVESRIDKVREAIDKKLDRSGVSPDRKKAIHKMIDEEAKDIRDAVGRAGADGSVTEGEATKVKTLTMALRARVRERMRAEKNPAAKAILERQKQKAEEEKAQKAKTDQAVKAKAEKEKAAAAVKQAQAAKEKATKEAAAKQKEAAAKQKAALAKAKAAKAKAPGPTKQAKVKPGKKAKKAKAPPAEAL